MNQKGFTRLQKLIVANMALILLGGGTWFFVFRDNEQTDTTGSGEITSFEECAEAGYPIMESYPEQCAVPGGETFVRQLSEEEQNRLDEAIDGTTEEAKAEAIRQAEAYQPDGICTQALTPAVHIETGAKYTFNTGCLPPGWEPDPNPPSDLP